MLLRSLRGGLRETSRVSAAGLSILQLAEMIANHDQDLEPEIAPPLGAYLWIRVQG